MARRPSRAAEPLIAVYGRTYWDAEVRVDLASLAAGKGKIDARVDLGHGGFALNAARGLGRRFPAGALRVVTLTSWHEWPRLAAALPAGAVLDAILSDDTAPPPVSIIVNPARECRILRDRQEHDSERWRVDRVPVGALSARLHIVGRLPAPFVAGVLAQAHARGARLAWVGGDALGEPLERELDLMCVNSREAERLLGRTGTPREMAEALARRARGKDAVRVVTGAGRAATAAVFRVGRSFECVESRPAAIAPDRIATLKGVGDAFAAHFLAAACFDARGVPRRRLDVAGALAAAQRVATRFIAAKVAS